MAHIHVAKESDVHLRSRSRNRDRVREKQRRDTYAVSRIWLRPGGARSQPRGRSGTIIAPCSVQGLFFLHMGHPREMDVGPIPLARSCEARACDSELKKAGPREAVVLMPPLGACVGCEVPR